MAAPLDACFAAAAHVERWPSFLPHYRHVGFTNPADAPLTVLMKAYRDFGPIRYPIWWESEMEIDDERSCVRYRHIAGVTTGMDVEWRLAPRGGETHIVIVHEWTGPGWPLIGEFAARQVICPRFVHVVAGRTLAGIKRSIESEAA
ncbi:MAG: SRPBCC family protein [Gemmatimonadota bacterium]